MCRLVLQILTLCQTKICHFSHPFSDLTFKIRSLFSDQNGRDVCPFSDQNGQSVYPFSDQKVSHFIPFEAARTYMAYIRGYPTGKEPLPEVRLAENEYPSNATRQTSINNLKEYKHNFKVMFTPYWITFCANTKSFLVWYQQSKGTELEQVVHTYRTSSCLTGWPRGFGELNPRCSLNISFRLSWSQSSFLVYTTPKCGTVPIRYVTLHVLPSAFIQVILKQWTS